MNHIIEHSVLDRSKNYTVKSPFKEMLKGSLGSFINAMTSTDYTTYPVASTNEQDLDNNFDAKWDEISKNLQDTYKLAFNRNGLIVSCSGSEKGAKILNKEFNGISPEINSRVLPNQKYTFTKPDNNTAFSSSSIEYFCALKGGEQFLLLICC